MLRTPKGMNKAKAFRNLQNLERRRKGGTEMSVTLRHLKIIIPKITLEHLLTQGITVKLIQGITRGLERKVMVLMVLVQVLGMVLIMTAMIGMGSLADILLADRRMKGKGAISILFMIDLVTDMVARKGIGMSG
jgi:SNF family Na+-dependent transporter